MNKRIVIVLVILAVLIAAAAAAVLLMSRPVEIAMTTVETQDAPAQTETVEETAAAEAAETSETEEEEMIELVELYGQITEITDEYVMMTADGLGEVKVQLTEDTVIEGVEALEIGQTAKVLYTGMMTRSLPPQITALLIGVYVVTGEVTAVEEGRVTITGENGEVILTLPEGADAPAVGEAITAYTTGVSTMSIPPQMNAVAVETVDSVG